MIATLSLAADAMSGVLHGNNGPFDGISTDTRTISDGQLFFALQGPNFDGRDYVGQAKAKGAAGAVVSSMVDHDIAQINVADAQQALGRFGAAWRNGMDVCVVGVTGSNGKTTLKELIAACLCANGPTLATAGNLNNDIGMPLMLARIKDNHKFAVLEMGANHAGEIAYLASLANSDIVVISNAGAAHLEGFGSIAGVAKAKGEILQNEKRPKFAVLNADDTYFDYWTSLCDDIEVLSFGLETSADFCADNIVTQAHGSDFRLHTPDGSVQLSMPLAGIHNVQNACAAAAVAKSLGLSNGQIKRALEGIAPVAGRLQPLAGINGCTLFDDSYNANPRSVSAAAEFLASLPGEGWLILGDMKELGDSAKQLHCEVGALARVSGVDRLFAFGELAKHCCDGFGDGAKWYETLQALLEDVKSVTADVNVLVKGSRSMRMERVVVALQAVKPVRKEA